MRGTGLPADFSTRNFLLPALRRSRAERPSVPPLSRQICGVSLHARPALPYFVMDRRGTRFRRDARRKPRPATRPDRVSGDCLFAFTLCRFATGQGMERSSAASALDRTQHLFRGAATLADLRTGSRISPAASRSHPRHWTRSRYTTASHSRFASCRHPPWRGLQPREMGVGGTHCAAPRRGTGDALRA